MFNAQLVEYLHFDMDGEMFDFLIELWVIFIDEVDDQVDNFLSFLSL
jgi:hypothetical protein